MGKMNSALFAFAFLALFAGTLGAADASVNIYQGWNIISSPFGHYDAMDSSGCDFSGNFYHYLPQSNEYSKSTALTVQDGFWVYSRNACSIKFTSTTADGAISSYPLYTGWNMVGQPFISDASSVNFADVIGDCKVVSGPWEYTTSINNYTRAATLSRGKGVWIKVSANCALKSTTPPEPPNTDDADSLIKSGTVGVGQTLDAGSLKVKFVNFDGSDTPVYANLQLLDANDAALSAISIMPKTYYKYAAPSGTAYLIYVEEMAAGYSHNAQWAKMRIYKVNGEPDALASIQLGDEQVMPTDSGANKDVKIKTGIINIGQVLDAGEMKVKLADLAINNGAPGAAILDILDPNDAIIKQMVIPAGGMKTIRMPTGAVYAIYAKETAPGITLNAKWANLDIYKVNGNPDTGSMMLSFVERPSSGTAIAASGSLPLGQELFVNSGASSFKVRVDDLSKFPSTTGAERKPAIVSILDANDAVVMWRVLPVGKGILYISPTNERFVIYVESTSFNAQSLAANAMVFVYRLSASDSTNQAPVITGGIGGLSSVKVGEPSTWSVDAYDPENGSLTYSVIWGDETTLPKTATKYPMAAQTATFTHVYYRAGNYSIVITVADDQGATAQATKAVTATGSSANQTKTVKVTSPSAGATLTQGQTYAVTWSYSPDMANYLYYIHAISTSDGEEWNIYSNAALDTISKGSYSWKVSSSLPAGDYKIRVGIQPQGAAPYFDSGAIHVAAIPQNTTPAKTVKVTSPSTGATLTKGQSYTITWSYSPDMANYLYYIKAISSADSDTEFNINSNAALKLISSGSYTWKVSSSLPAGDYKIRVGIQPQGAAPYFDSGAVKIVDATAPDLAVTAIDFEQQSGDSQGNRIVVIKPTVKNIGAATSNSFDATLYVDNRIMHSETGFGPLAPGGNKGPSSFDSSAYSSGWHIARFVISNYGADSNTANNEMSKQFYVEPVANKAPTISSTGGPTTINVNEQGTWSISAYDPDGNYLSYNIRWGDESLKGTSPQVFSTATFTHTYTQAGTYTITYTVTDDKGATAQATLTVAVTQPAVQPTAKTITVTSPSSGATLTKGQTYTVSWSSPNAKDYLRYIKAESTATGDEANIESPSMNLMGESGSVSWTVPTWLTAGSYSIIVGAQPGGPGTIFGQATVSIVDPVPAAN